MVARIFLSYAREDEAQVRDVYRRLLDAGFEVWMDKPRHNYLYVYAELM